LVLAVSKEDENVFGVKRARLAGFGIGLSMAVIDIYINNANIFPIIHTDSK